MIASASSSLRNREAIDEPPNPLGLDGIEFIEFATRRPQALGQVLETMGFRPIARHRSREVLLYRQGSMNIVINAHAEGLPEAVQPGDMPEIAAIALRVRDAGAAWRRAIQRGGWPVPAEPALAEVALFALAAGPVFEAGALWAFGPAGTSGPADGLFALSWRRSASWDAGTACFAPASFFCPGAGALWPEWSAAWRLALPPLSTCRKSLPVWPVYANSTPSEERIRLKGAVPPWMPT